MDYFDFDTIENYICKSKSNIKERLKNIALNERNLQSSSDLLCQVLDYSPSMDSDVRYRTKVQLKENQTLSELLPPIESTIQIVEEAPIELDDKIIRDIIEEILNKVVNGNEKVPSESDNDEDDDDDEYERALERRRHQIDKKQNSFGDAKKSKGIKGSVSKIANLFSDTATIRIYILNTKKYIEIDITGNDTVYSLKKLIIEKLLDKNSKFSNIHLHYQVPEAFVIRLVDEDEDEPNMDFGPLEDDLNIAQSKSNRFSFMEIANFKPSADKNTLLGESSKKDTVNIRIYIQKDNMGSSSKIIAMNKDSSLKNVLEWLSNRDLLKFKNIDLYYFVSHNDEKEDDLDNALNLDTIIRMLPSLELDLKVKNLPDVPDVVIDKKDNDGNGEKVYIYNDISAGKLQEFEVIKTNKFNVKQERILGIDLYYIYNNIPKNKSNGIFNKFFGEKTKKPMRKIKDIKNIGVIDNHKFFILMKKNETEEEKKMVYEVKDINTRNEIMAKLQFLIKLNHENEN